MSLLELIKQPRTLDESAVDAELLLDLTLKHFFDGGVRVHSHNMTPICKA